MAEPKFDNPIVRWIDYRLPVFTFMHHEMHEYPTPKNLNYWWNFGSLAGFMLIVMIVTGIMLAMHYTPHVDHAFDSVERIRRDVPFGWLIQFIHMNGASFFFILVYIHIFRGLYYGSYKSPREILWILGVVILLLMMATAFMGYVLPWGQMSFWGATVITNLFSRDPAGRGRDRELAVGRLRGGQPDPQPVLFAALPPCRSSSSASWCCMWWRCTRTAPTIRSASRPAASRTASPSIPTTRIKDMFGLGAFLTIFCLFVFLRARLSWATRTTMCRRTRW